MSNSGGPLPLKTLRLKPLREEEMMSTVGASTGGVQKLQRRRPPPPPSRRKTKQGPPGGGHHEKKKKGEAGFAGASDRGTGLKHDLKLCRAGQPQPHGAANGEKGTRARTSGHNARGRYGRGKTQTAANPASQPDAGVRSKGTRAPAANGEEDCSCKS